MLKARVHKALAKLGTVYRERWKLSENIIAVQRGRHGVEGVGKAWCLTWGGRHCEVGCIYALEDGLEHVRLNDVALDDLQCQTQ